MKKFSFFILFCINIFIINTSFSPKASTGDIILEKAYCLIHAESGKILSEYNKDERLAPASLTKMMVMLIAAEKIKSGELSLDEEIVTSPAASARDGSVIWLEPGELMKLSELLKAIAISSANDAAYSVSEKISGSEAAFVTLMNMRAAAIGMKNTHYDNCVGYDSENHYSTASDSAILMAELIKHNDIYGEFWKTRVDSVRTGTDRESQLVNTNKLTEKYTGLIGGKTGTTDNAGYCLATAANRSDLTLVAVVMGSKSDDDRTVRIKNLLNNGFENYRLFTPDFEELPESIKVIKGIEKSIPLKITDAGKYVIKKGQEKDINIIYRLPENITAPIKEGEVIGKVSGELKTGEFIFEVPVVAATKAKKYTFAAAFQFIGNSLGIG